MLIFMWPFYSRFQRQQHKGRLQLPRIGPEQLPGCVSLSPTGTSPARSNFPALFRVHRGEATTAPGPARFVIFLFFALIVPAPAAVAGATALGGNFPLLFLIHGGKAARTVVGRASTARGNFPLFLLIHGGKATRATMRGASALGSDFPLAFRVHGGESTTAAATARVGALIPFVLLVATAAAGIFFLFVTVSASLSAVTGVPAARGNFTLLLRIHGGKSAAAALAASSVPRAFFFPIFFAAPSFMFLAREASTLIAFAVSAFIISATSCSCWHTFAFHFVCFVVR